MNNHTILKIYGKDYKEMTKRLLAEANLASEIPDKNSRIGIKPNLVSPTPADYGATTHPEVVAGIIGYLQENGFFNLMILESSWVGDVTTEAFEYCGYNELSRRYGVPLFDLQKDSSHEKDCAGLTLCICDKVDEVDFLINVPVLKGHCQTKITCALKNSKGLIPNTEKRHFHAMGLHRPIAHLGVGIHQDFIVVDHICGDLDFEDGGHPVVRNCVMAAKDPVLMDAYVCRLLHYQTSDVPYIEMAEALGVGCADLSKAEITVLGEDLGAELPVAHKVVDVQDVVWEVESCSACYANLIPALNQLREEGLLEKLTEKIAIGQGWREKNGTLGVGNCTRGFAHCIPGCPPESEQIYRELKARISAAEGGQTNRNPPK